MRSTAVTQATVLAFLSLAEVGVVWMFPDKIPDCACVWMAPWHVPFTEAASDPPYQLTISNSNVRSDTAVPMCLVGTIPIEGFMVQVHDTEDNPIGSFITNSTITQPMNCKGLNDTATHVSSKKHMMINFLWMPPYGYSGKVFFKATVLRTYHTYWTGISSNMFTVTN
ncbi:defense protein l(2)34Fc-like [Homarus americanus]|uniref:Defense protein l(2)34Fc-like n=1 Tax=Homarus americanus TaxID=6706 RepID=A0A8J5JGL0_HOMAM|nr:defense protein l(2)34Fc-like [Homarus americanus]XP_042243252.1 defense protein l(2)34Fc-like [Homarus americanus]KAG7157350.1 Defense protein l(2)34Fc-like [Homarus americanus]